MKNICPVVLAVLLLTGISFAQIGVTGGVNVSNFKGVGVFNFNNRTGITVGLYLDLPGSGFGFMPSVLYSQKGATFSSSEYNDNGELVSIDATMKYDYIEIPLMAKYTIEINRNVSSFLQAGPYLGFLISSTIAGTGSAAGQDPLTVVNYITDQPKFDYGFAFGGGAIFNFGNTSINVNICYSIGMLSAVKNQLQNSGLTVGALAAENNPLKNSALSIMVGFLL